VVERPSATSGGIMEYSREKQISDDFFLLGSQYYAIATHAAHPSLIPVCGNLFHHAIEMLLKGYLANNNDIKKLREMRHNLVKLWHSFKAGGDDPNLNNFDSVIAKLDRFENIRYPESIVDNNMIMGVSTNVIAPRLIDQFPSATSRYEIKVDELDKLVATIFHRARVTPSDYFGKLPNVFKNSIPPDLRGQD
jgi:hypothetical protein